MARQIPYRQELIRKLFHLSALVIPVSYHYMGKEILWILVPFTALVMFIDIGRNYLPPVNKLVNFFFAGILRSEEKTNGKKSISGASPLFLSAVICFYFFPKEIAIASFSILIISDSAAALIGRKFGRTKLLGTEKTLEGSLAFATTAVLIILFVWNLYGLDRDFLIAGTISALLATDIEFFSKMLGIDDNLTIPIGTALLITAISSIL